MVEVRLHGALAAEFGRVWHFDIATPAEAIRALSCARPRFLAAIRELSNKGYVYRVRAGKHDYNNDDVGTHLGELKRVDIVPIVVGAGSGVRFVIGAVLFAYGTFGQAYGGGPWAQALGASLMFGAVAEWLAPKPKKQDFEGGAKSWTLNGPTNTVDQGEIVPVIYGEVLTGARTISAGVTAAQVNPAGSLDADVLIGGRREYDFALQGPGSGTIEATLAASPFNVHEPYQFTWSVAGFPRANAVRVVGANNMRVYIEVDYTVPDTVGFPMVDTGNVSVTLKGRNERDEEVTVTDTAALSMTVMQLEPWSGGG